LGGIFIWTGRQRVIDALNFIFSAIVVWNLCNLLLIPIH